MRTMEIDEETAGRIKGLCERYRMEPRAVVERAVSDLVSWCEKREAGLVWNDSKGNNQLTMEL